MLYYDFSLANDSKHTSIKAMTILSIAASGIVAATAAFFAFSAAAPRTASSDTSRPNPHLRADQRGMTLQTLIIMAVLVVIATGVSVVLVGVTRGANDGLESAGKASSEAKCEPWEIHDPNYESQGIGGPTGLGGVWSSKIGCIRACYAKFNAQQMDPGLPAASLVDIILSYEDDADRPRDATFTVASLEFSRHERITQPLAVPGSLGLVSPLLNTAILTIGGSQSYEYYFGPDHHITRSGGAEPNHTTFTKVITNSSEVDDPIPIDDLEIRVADDLRSCMLWDPANSKEIFRSQGTI